MVFKCKMCGGDIESISPYIGKCKYCKSTMTLPNIEDEKKINLYNRANSLRLENEFDKAYNVYETILEIDNNEVEAHWGLLLCKYGVEYVDDPKTKKKIPTCHRTLLDSILKDKDYEFVVKNSYGSALELYKEEAKLISDIQKKILNISTKEEPYDVFICYKETTKDNERTHDSVIAQDIYDNLTKEGYKVFFARITLEDKIGVEYEPYIFSALTSAKVMLVVGTSIENYEAVWVKNEWSRYLEFMKKDKSKVLVPVYSKMDAYKLPEEFAMLQAQNMDKVGAMQDLIRGVKKILDSKTDKKIDDDVLKQVKAALDEEASIGDDKFEVTEVKEKLPIWYYVVLVCSTGLLMFMKLASYFDSFALNLFSQNNLGLDEISYILVGIQFIIALAAFVAMIMKLKSRTLYKKSNYLYFGVLVLEFISALICLRHNCIVYLLWFASVILEFALYFINPKWHLDASSKAIVTKLEKEKLLEKNKKIRTEFEYKSKSPIKKKIFFLTLGISIIIYIILGGIHIFIPNENGRNEDVSQIKIEYDTLNFRNSMDLYPSSVIGILRKGEYYTILDTRIAGSEHEACLAWYKIKTKKNVTGYVCGFDSNNIYVELLLTENDIKKFSNGRDITKRQLEVTNSYLKIREEPNSYSEKLGFVIKGSIFDIIDSKRPGEVTWYKIKTNEDVVGWLSGSYVKVYEKEVN